MFVTWHRLSSPNVKPKWQVYKSSCVIFTKKLCTVFQKERVEVGDVIYIEANSGAVKRLGRSDAFATEFDLEAEELVFLFIKFNFVANGISSMSD